MYHYIYRLSDGQFLRGLKGNTPDYDPATEGLQTYDTAARPDLRTERYDAASPMQKRPATAQELADWDAARQTAREQAQFDEAKMLKAVAIWTAQRLGVPLATARAEILAVYRGLP